MPNTPFPIDVISQKFIDGRATEAEIKELNTDPTAFAASLFRLLDLAEDALESARRNFRGPERANVLVDLDEDCYDIDEAITALIGPPTSKELNDKPTPARKQTPIEKPAAAVETEEVGVPQLQLAWNQGQIVAWVGGMNAKFGTHDEIRAALDAAGASAIDWQESHQVKVTGLGRLDTLSASTMSSLGWLVAQARPTNNDQLGASVRWVGITTATAVGLVAQGKFVPQLKQARRSKGSGGGKSTFSVRWQPALLDSQEFEQLVASIPGAAMVGQQRQDAKSFVSGLIGDVVNSIVKMAAAQVEVPAAPPTISDRNDIGEAILALLNGQKFEAPSSPGSEVVRRMTQWAAPISGTTSDRIIVQLAPPDESNAWLASVLAESPTTRIIEPFEVALGAASKARAKVIEAQISRLERIFPPLLRPGGRRRGEVILSQDEAWQLMTEIGPVLTTAGYDVRVPPLSRKKPAASLRLTAEESQEGVVGAQQLADVRWSAVFGDVELTAEEISRLAAEARPLVQSRGQWVELDQVDLAEAAEALAERSDINRLSGADMLRHALGLEGSQFAGGVDLSGVGWAADLLRGVEELPEFPETKPEGFAGELRSYQADALSWLDFLDGVGLGGCLALDMGLGKTPTTLASLQTSVQHGTCLVIAPPAVVGNWATEAAKFMPNLKVHVHHGASRLRDAKLSGKVRDSDVVITTYGTAVRDMDQLAEFTWGKVVIDEAQAIKNPTAETSIQLRRLDARTRIALTGTPIENGLGDLWAIMDWANPGLVGDRAQFVAQLTPDSKGRGAKTGEDALKALNGILVYRRTKAEPEIAKELPDRIDELDHCAMTPEQIGLYKAVVDSLIIDSSDVGTPQRKGAVLAAITALKQICNHPVNYQTDDKPLDDRSGKLLRLNEIMESVFAADEKMLIFTHFATWGDRLATHLSDRTGKKIECYHGGLSRTARDKMIDDFQNGEGAGALVLSLKAGGTGLNLTGANHVVLYDRWWNPAVEDQARDRVWRIGQTKTVICHRLVCPGTIDERVEEIVSGKRQIANMVLPKSSSVGDLNAEQLQTALGLDPDLLIDIESDSEPVGAA